MNFFNIPILATAISIIIAWALFAIFCSYLHEAIAQVKSERGRFFKQYLFKQFQDLPNGVNWASMLYLHGTIDMLSREPEKPTNDISPELFARTMIETVGNAHLVQMQAGTLTKPPAYQNDLLNKFAVATMVLKPSDAAIMFKQSFQDAHIKATGTGGIVDEAKLYQGLIANIEQWYNELGERISLWYKKKTRQRLFILGMLLGAILNVDSIQLFKYFDTNPAARTQMMSYYEKHQTQLQAAADSIKAKENRTSQDTSTIKDKITQVKVIGLTLDTLAQNAALPIGVKDDLYYTIIKKSPLDKTALLLKLIGIFITGFAVSFGAPFWFDVLKKMYTLKK